MQALKLIFILAAASCIYADEKFLATKPAGLKPCSLKDSGLNTCLANNVQALFKQWKSGVPGLPSVGALDPMLVKQAKLQRINTPLASGDAELQNLVITGAGNVVVKEVSFDKKTFGLKVKLFVPSLNFQSDYTAKGFALTKQVNTKGKATFQADNVLATVDISVKLRDAFGHTFHDITTFKVKLESVSNFHVDIKNLFNGNAVLEKAANKSINDQWKDLFDVLRGQIEEVVQQVMDERFRKLYSYIPATYFISDIPTAKAHAG